jgi:DNA-binding CsgD family transcriptional regulator
MRILIVEKNKLYADLLAAHLEKLGNHTQNASCWNNLIEMLPTYKPQAIIFGETITISFSNEQIQNLFRDGRCQVQQPYILSIDESIKFPSKMSVIQPGMVTNLGVNFNLTRFSDFVTEIAAECEKSRSKPEGCLKDHDLSQLRPSERHILILLIQGNSTRRIAKLLSRSVETIKNHRKSIKQKLGIRGGKSVFLSNFRQEE